MEVAIQRAAGRRAEGRAARQQSLDYQPRGARQNLSMAREIKIGDRLAIIATVGKRIEERVALHIPTANFPYSIIDPKAKPGERMRFAGDVVYVDEDLGRVTVQVLGRVTVEASTVELVSKFRRPTDAEPLRRRASKTAPKPAPARRQRSSCAI